jgi:hypothetical protein
VALADVNNDGWLDIVTATTYMDSDPKHIGHPRVYINKGCSGACDGTADWLGFRYEEARIPELLSDSLQAGFQPRFCSIYIADYNNDGWVDLWFADYDNGQPAGADFNMKLLVNQGAANPGFFTDVTETVFTGGASGYNDIGFGASSAIVDFNDDGHPDLIKQSPGNIAIAYQDASTPGFFDDQETVYTNSGYFMNYGELNNDGLPDLIISDDGADRYLLNQGPGGDGRADFIGFVFSFQHLGVGGSSSDDGFSGNSIAADLDNDGWNDVLITDADVDVGGCTRRTHIYKNLGGTQGGNITLQEQTEGSNCQTFQGNPASCLIAGIPSNKLEGTHDIAVFDINNDGWKDLVVGRCDGTEVYINNPPTVPAGGIPDGKIVAGEQLMVERVAFGAVRLDWGDSCSEGDLDYAIFEGTIGDYTSHTEMMCSTAGATTQTFFPSSGSQYYLVVPISSGFEGSYGYDSSGAQRPQGTTSCRPQALGACD